MKTLRLLVVAVFVGPLFPSTLLAADKTVVTDKVPPTASAPSVVINNSDVCKSAASSCDTNTNTRFCFWCYSYR